MFHNIKMKIRMTTPINSMLSAWGGLEKLRESRNLNLPVCRQWSMWKRSISRLFKAVHGTSRHFQENYLNHRLKFLFPAQNPYNSNWNTEKNIDLKSFTYSIDELVKGPCFVLTETRQFSRRTSRNAHCSRRRLGRGLANRRSSAWPHPILLPLLLRTLRFC